MDATSKSLRRVRKKRRSSAGARPAPKGKRLLMGAGLMAIVAVACLAVYGMVGTESAAAVVPGWQSSR